MQDMKLSKGERAAQSESQGLSTTGYDYLFTKEEKPCWFVAFQKLKTIASSQSASLAVHPPLHGLIRWVGKDDMQAAVSGATNTIEYDLGKHTIAVRMEPHQTP